MIIIKIIILYSIQITHTDDFPSTGTRLVTLIHSNSDLLFTARVKTPNGSRSFSVAGPTLWN